MTIDISSIKLNSDSLDREIFSTVAEKAARDLGTESDIDTSTQIRRFYDEFVMWYDKINMADDKEAKLHEFMPYIQMIRAKVAYAKGRKKVSLDFEQLIARILDQIMDFNSFKNAKLFFEAFVGFRKAINDK